MATATRARTNDGIDSITISTPDRSVTLTRETGERIDEHLGTGRYAGVFGDGAEGSDPSASDAAAKQEPRAWRVTAPSQGRFEGADFLQAPELERLVRDLVERHPAFSHLRDARFKVLWKRKGGAGKGKATLGKTQKPSGMLAYFAEFDFVIWVAADHVKGHQFSQQQIEALVYHELCHCGWEENEDDEAVALGAPEGRYVVEPHDVESFAAEIRTYGLWKQDLQEMGEAVRQLRLDDAA